MTETVQGDPDDAPRAPTIRSSDKQRHTLQPLIDGLGRAVARTGIHPDVLTLLSLAIAAYGTFLLIHGEWLVAPWVFLAAGILDVLDGAVARHTDRVSKAGGYLDSLVDRYVDFFILFGVMVAVDERIMWIVGSIAIFGTLMTSAARWRVHEDHHPTRTEWGGRDLFGRTERLTLLLSGIFVIAFLERITPRGYVDENTLALWLIVALAAFTNLTVLQRILKARRVLRRLD